MTMTRVQPLALIATATLVATAGAQTQVLVDPGFEANPLNGYATVLNNFVQYQGQWGAERGDITGATGQILPPEGSKMLRMRNDGLSYTQTVQVTDISAFAQDIDAGEATISVGGLFNADPGLSDANGFVLARFYTGPGLIYATSYISMGIVLDTDPATWQSLDHSDTIPVGTRWIVSEMSYRNVSIGSLAGYVDDMHTLITTPGGEFHLDVSASCPAGGPILISWTRASANGWLVLISSRDEGRVTIPRIYPCGGTRLGLGSQRIQSVWTGPAGALGRGSLMDHAGPRACGLHLQLLDLANCETSNVARIE